MKRKTITLITLPFISFVFGIFESFGTTDGDDKTLVFEKFTKPWVNDSQFLDVNGTASIDIAVLFDDKGVVDDWIPVRTNDMKLVQSIRNVVNDWKIKPPMMDGIPSWSYVNLTVRFQHRGAVVSLTPAEMFMSATGSLRDNFEIVVPFSELDSIPVPIEMEQPKLSKKLIADNRGATVKFEFFIDQEGRVRMPIVKEAETEEMAAAIMLRSLLMWRFEPPTRRGRPVVTQAIIPFKVPE